MSLDNYVNDLYCYVDFASECDGQGVDIEFTRMAIESSGYVNVNGLWIEKDGCFYDSVKFMYTDVNGATQYTEEDCGIFNGDAWDISSWYHQTPATTKLSLVGTDMKMVFDSDYSINGGFVDFNWQCRSYGNDICPFKYDGSADSGCYAQSGLWSPGKCQVASSLNGDKIEYGVRLSSPGNEVAVVAAAWAALLSKQPSKSQSTSLRNRTGARLART